MDKLKLEYEMKKKGLTVDHLCAKIGISRASYYRKTNGVSEFTLSEMQNIIDLLGIDTPVGIFFADVVS